VGFSVAALDVDTLGLAATADGFDNILTIPADVAFSEVLYHENRNRGIRFACVCPPPVNTPPLEQAEGA
jgi:hypothetical protein